jgi:hypothetical protein
LIADKRGPLKWSQTDLQHGQIHGPKELYEQFWE